MSNLGTRTTQGSSSLFAAPVFVVVLVNDYGQPCDCAIYSTEEQARDEWEIDGDACFIFGPLEGVDTPFPCSQVGHMFSDNDRNCRMCGKPHPLAEGQLDA